MTALDQALVVLAIVALVAAEYIAVSVLDKWMACTEDANDRINERRRRQPSVTYSQGQILFAAANDSDACDYLIDLSVERTIQP
jgi:hypothetical protein